MLTRDFQKQEAIKRMENFGMYDRILHRFRENETIFMSEGIHFYTLDEDIKEQVEKFEKDTGSLVYHVIHNQLLGMDLYTFLFVGDTTDDFDWERGCPLDPYDKSERIIFVYCYNKTYDEFSEYGDISFKFIGGIPVRVV